MIWNPPCTTPKFYVSSIGGRATERGLSNKKKQRDRNRLVDISVQNFLSLYFIYIFRELFSLSPVTGSFGLFLVFFGVLDWMFVMPLW
jgi:hypothetical protein